MAVAVRRATEDDGVRIAELAIRLVEQHIELDPFRFSHIATEDRMAVFYGGPANSDHSAVFVAESDGEIVGFTYVSYEEISYEDLATNVGWIHDIYIDQADRRVGVGRELIKVAADYLKEKGATKLLLWTAEKNHLGREFFQHLGLKTTMREMMLDLTKDF
jgi:GNAT superfamily N-acetyltransferase